MAHDLGDPPAAPRRRTRKERDAAARARLVGSLSELADVGVRAVRLQYADLHGICRGKLIPISAFPNVAEEGMGFVEAIMTVDLRHNVVAGFEHGFPDLLGRPDLDTLVPLPWEEDVVACLVDLEDPVTDGPHPLDCRGVLKRVLAQFSEFGVSPVVGPELEFYLMEPDPSDPRGWRPYAGQDSAVYTVGDMADPKGTLANMLDAAVELELGAIAAAHEYGRSQFEINLQHSAALDSCRPRVPLPRDGQGDGGARRAARDVHGQAVQRRRGVGLPPPRVARRLATGANAGEASDGAHGLTPVMCHFIAGVMEHAPAMMVFFNPTVNAYRRISAEALVPTRVCWGHDHRMTLVRVPKERGSSTRLELRLGDGTANPYLAYAAALAAGLDGIRRELELPEPVEGMIYDLPDEALGARAPDDVRRGARRRSRKIR